MPAPDAVSSNAVGSSTAERLSVGGVELEVMRRGAGRPMLLLHGMQNSSADAPFLDLLGRHAEIIAPSHPGFGNSARPADFETVYDLVHLYLDVLDALPYEQGDARRVVVRRLARRGDRGEVRPSPRPARPRGRARHQGQRPRDARHPGRLQHSPQEVQRRSWHDPAAWAPDFDAMSDDELVVRARNWEALCLYGWHPYMYNPQLKRWLAPHRGADPGAVGRERSDRDARLWTAPTAGLIPGRALRADRGGGAPPGDRAARDASSSASRASCER